jgi:phosphate transporter
VWRQMIGKERRGEGADGQVKALGLGHTDSHASPLFTLFGLKFTKKKVFLSLAVVVFTALLNVQMVEGQEANRCLAILIFSTILWATEVRSIYFSQGVNVLNVTLGYPIIHYIHGGAPDGRLLGGDTGL